MRARHLGGRHCHVGAFSQHPQLVKNEFHCVLQLSTGNHRTGSPSWPNSVNLRPHLCGHVGTLYCLVPGGLIECSRPVDAFELVGTRPPLAVVGQAVFWFQYAGGNQGPQFVGRDRTLPLLPIQGIVPASAGSCVFGGILLGDYIRIHNEFRTTVRALSSAEHRVGSSSTQGTGGLPITVAVHSVNGR